MSRRYPRIRHCNERGVILVREGVVFSFFMRHSHTEVAPGVLRALDVYRRATGPATLDWYVDENGDWQPLDDAGWEHTRREFRESGGARIELRDQPDDQTVYSFEYHGYDLGSEPHAANPGMVSAASFWLPVEFLEEHGPSRVSELALEMVSELPVSSGYVSLGLNARIGLGSVLRAISEQCSRYPGMDVNDLSTSSRAIGTKVRGAYWLNFYGQPLLGQLGGAEGLRARLSGEGISVEELEGDRVLVRLGEWPEAGADSENMRPYRALARVLEPHLYEEPAYSHRDVEQIRHWRRRFLG